MNRSNEIGLYGTGMKDKSRSMRTRPSRSLAVGWGVRYRLKRFWPESAARGRLKMISLIACVAAIIVISAIASVLTSDAKKASDPKTEEVTSGVIIIQAEPPPYYVAGHTYDALGVAMTDCLVNVTNLRTGSWNLTTSSATTGLYRWNLWSMDGDFLEGDTINVTATKGLMTGWNQSVVPTPMGSYLTIDVTLGTEIPEFPMAIVPIAGILVLVVAFSAMRRGKEQ